jgi:polar amino acid transport system substrate-binding protein
MKKYILCLMSFYNLTIGPVLAETIKARSDRWCPYNCEPQSSKPGIFVEQLQIIFKKAGIVIDYAVLPWAQSVADVRSGRFDAAIGVAGPDAKGMIHTLIPQDITNTCAFGLNNSKISIHKATDLKKLKSIGVVKDYSYGDFTDKMLTSPDLKEKVSAMATDEALNINIRRLLDGKIEALLEDSNVMINRLKERHIINIKSLGCTEDKVPVWIGFTESNPKSKIWVEILSKGQAELEKSGKLSEIYGRYGIKH